MKQMVIDANPASARPARRKHSQTRAGSKGRNARDARRFEAASDDEAGPDRLCEDGLLEESSTLAAPLDEIDLEERLLEQIGRGGKLCREIETQLRQHPSPELETIIKLHRVMVLRLSSEAQAVPEMFKLVSGLMKPLMEWARLEEQRKTRELAERKYQDEVAAQEAAKGQEGPGTALKTETLEKIEHELKLF